MVSSEFAKNFDDSTNMKKNEKNVKNVKEIDVVVMIKALFEKKDCRIIDFKKRVSHALKDDFDVSNIQDFENIEKSSLTLIKRKIDEVTLFVTRIYIVAWIIVFDDFAFFDQNDDASHIVNEYRRLNFAKLRLQIEKLINNHVIV